MSAAATGQQHAHARRTASRARTARARLAPPLVAPPPTPDTTDERRRTTTKRCCVLTRAQSRRRRSMGYGGTGPPPRQRGVRLVPLIRAWLTLPHGRHHKAPPWPCALTTISARLIHVGCVQYDRWKPSCVRRRASSARAVIAPTPAQKCGNAVTTAGDNDITYHNHNETILRGL